MITETMTDTKRDAKQSILDNRRFPFIERLKATDKAERAATVSHIDGILSADLSPEHIAFWNEVRADILKIAGAE